ncbi:RAB6-interacting golgin, partial [Takifugu rubripes]|uniref:RAB6-interacting golgin n=1 Tax=Takifugu rubripes TaxID=31033 RepID=UPI001145CBC0
FDLRSGRERGGSAESFRCDRTPISRLREGTNPDVKELDKEEVEVREKTRLEQLQHEQKMIEERNKRTKALLAKTIAEKSKQTQEEAVKLKRIQKELQALDDMVSSDISILRDRIEEASWDYSADRKRYEKAESEYVTSKLDLHRKTEVKEQLTEHLYAIIQAERAEEGGRAAGADAAAGAAPPPRSAERQTLPRAVGGRGRGRGAGPDCQQRRWNGAF